MALSDLKKQTVGIIESDIQRGVLVDGVYSSAIFRFGKNTFIVVADYTVDGERKGSAIFKNGELYRGSVVSNGRYRDLYLDGNASLMEHQILAVALIPDAVKLLTCPYESYVINHKTIHTEAVEARKRYLEAENKAYMRWAELFAKNRLHEFDYSEFRVEGFQPPCDVRDLEIVTTSLNNAHNAFIHNYELYDTPISAYDVHLFKELLGYGNHIEDLVGIYKDYGVDEFKFLFDCMFNI